VLEAKRAELARHLAQPAGARQHEGMRGIWCAALASLAAAAAPSHAYALERATRDRPDDVRGPQIHVIYALPNDGVDRALDTTGALGRSVEMFQFWLGRETGGPRLRMDTAGGELDVSFVRLPLSDAQIAARGAFVREEIEAHTRSAGFDRPNRIYAVYYDGSSTYACGGAFWPPQLTGNVVAMYLRGRPPGVSCDANPLPGERATPSYWEFAMLHDLLHGLGIVGTCAPHHTRAGHVSDTPADLMWAGDAPWRLPPQLDVGRDDYFGHGRADCPDLARSAYVTSNPPPPAVLGTSRWSVTAARAGRPLIARLSITVDGERAAPDAVRCSARLGGRVLPGAPSTSADGTASCRWKLPRTARGMRVRGAVVVTAAGRSLTRTFALLVR
jgi:hypothetical protein